MMKPLNSSISLGSILWIFCLPLPVPPLGQLYLRASMLSPEKPTIGIHVDIRILDSSDTDASTHQRYRWVLLYNVMLQQKRS